MLFKSEEKNQKPAEYATLNNRFMLRMPSEWRENTVYTFEGPEEDGIKHNILVTVDNDVEITDLVKYSEIQINAVQNELQGYNELKRGQISLNNGLPAYEIVFKWCPMEDREVYQRVVYVLNKNTGYTLTTIFSKRTWKIRGSQVDKILMSFSPQAGA